MEDARRPPLPACRRALRQTIQFIGYERVLRTGDTVAVEAEHTSHAVSLNVPADSVAEAMGTLRRWPATNLLAYHFPMIADEGRNGCFDRALRNAIRALMGDEHDGAHPRGAQSRGARPRVLDIGSGSGLLAMMAARAGAAPVTSLEMVPQLAAVARHIVNVNGYGDVISIVGQMSTSVTADEVDRAHSSV